MHHNTFVSMAIAQTHQQDCGLSRFALWLKRLGGWHTVRVGGSYHYQVNLFTNERRIIVGIWNHHDTSIDTTFFTMVGQGPLGYTPKVGEILPPPELIKEGGFST